MLRGSRPKLKRTTILELICQLNPQNVIPHHAQSFFLNMSKISSAPKAAATSSAV